MASLLQYCLQKTVKSPIQFFHKDIRLTNISNFWSSEHTILSKIEPKVTKVDPKNLKKRPIYVVKSFSATRCDRETILYRYYIQFGYVFFKFRVLRMLTQRCYWHITQGLCRPLGEGLILETNFISKTPQKSYISKIWGQNFSGIRIRTFHPDSIFSGFSRFPGVFWNFLFQMVFGRFVVK